MEFAWLSNETLPPGGWDLRALGWRLYRLAGLAEPATPGLPVLLDWRSASRPELPASAARRRHCLVIGVEDSGQRASLLADGFGDTVPAATGLAELRSRLMRVGGQAGVVPAQLSVGSLVLELMHRDARVGHRWLGLHPREFALLWRLREANGETVRRGRLLADVWRLSHDPGTNRIEVHVSRLRAKLVHFGYDGLVATDPEGGYFLDLEHWAAPRAWPWMKDCTDGISLE